MTTYTPLVDHSERRSRKQCIGLTLGGVLFSALLISSLVLNVHYFIRNNANQNQKHKQPSVGDSKIATFKDLKKVAKGAAACDGTDCPGGCCVGGYNWFCCTDGQHCAATEDDCPASKLMKMASMKAKSKKVVKGAAACDGTDCPTGCCVGEYDWFCCTDGQYCAATEDDCPATNIANLASFKAKSKKVVKGAVACDGTDCPGGCCVGEYNWFCCADGQYCAATEDDCPAPKMMKLASMKAKSKKVVKGAASCDGTDCPAGCCVGEYDWFCCADGQYCAATEDDCPAVNIINMARLKATSKKILKKLGKKNNL